MVATRKIIIHQLSDYNELLECVPISHIDVAIIEELKSVYGQACKAVIVEYPYYETDYLSTYYIFYAKKLKPFSKECYRLLFFSDTRCYNLIGYMSLRPTYPGTHLGRTYLEPEPVISNPAYLLLAESKVHFMGGEAVLNIFPHMKQEGDVAVCAHVSLWSVMRSFTYRFHEYPEVRLGQLVEQVKPKDERMIPSKGLSISQMCDVLLALNYSPLIISNSSFQDCSDAILTYIDSGIPVIGISSAASHAVTIVGHGEHETGNLIKGLVPSSWFEPYLSNSDLTQDLPKVILSTKLINSFYVNDDNFLPYRVVCRVPYASQTYFSSNGTQKNFRLQDFDYAIVPLYQRIQLGYQEAKAAFMALVQMGTYSWLDRIVMRMFISSANTYKEYVYENRQYFGKKLTDIITGLEMPRFIWCIEVSKPEDFVDKMVSAIAIIDSTSSTINADPFLLITEKEQIKLLNNREQKAYQLPVSFPRVPNFKKNLTEVNVNGKNFI